MPRHQTVRSVRDGPHRRGAKWKHRAAVLLGLMALEWAERRAKHDK